MRRKFGTVESISFLFGLCLVSAAVLTYQVLPPLDPLSYAAPEATTSPQSVRFIATHIKTPVQVKAVYMSQCLVSDRILRQRLVDLVNRTEINSIVIDIKDYSGTIVFSSTQPLLSDKQSRNCFAKDLAEFIDTLHQDGIYVIGRITVFQDPTMTLAHPELAVKYDSDRSKVWKDRKGISYVDPGAHEMWEYVVALSREAYTIGFDEINFDYIRFPSDGDMSNIYFPYSEVVVRADPTLGKASVLEEFYSYLHHELKRDHITISADLFGMTTTNTDDLNIGQLLESALKDFDYVAPMVYPSHYPPGFLNMANPALKPYEVVKYSMSEAVRRASTTPQQLRPWLQDFNLGAVYTADMVKAQMQAVYDSGLTSWMLWNAANRYTSDALLPN